MPGQTFEDGVEASEELLKLVFLTLDNGVDEAKEGKPLIPFMMTQAGEERKTERFVAELLEEGVANAKKAAAALPESVTACAVAYEGQVTFKGEELGAIIVEGSERGKDYGMVIAQRFKPPGDKKKFEPVGNAMYLGKTDNLFKFSK